MAKAGDRFEFDGANWVIVSFDCRQNRSQVAIDRGVDASGHERRIHARRLSDGFTRRLSADEINSPQTRSTDREGVR